MDITSLEGGHRMAAAAAIVEANIIGFV